MNNKCTEINNTERERVKRLGKGGRRTAFLSGTGALGDRRLVSG